MLEHVALIAAIAGIGLLSVLYWRSREQHTAVGAQASSFQTLAEIAPAGIWRTDARGQCLWVNKAWEEMSGLTDWHGEKWGDALHPEDKERLFASFMSAVARRVRFEDEWRWMRPDGETVWVKGLGAPEYAPDGELIGYVGLNIDIQRSKDLERDLTRAIERTEQEAQAKSTFLANMSHEIRTPMNGVIGFTDLLLQSPLDDDQRAQVQLISDSGRAMMQLLNDILDHSKIESGQMRIVPEPTSMRHKLQHCLALMEPMARAKGLALGLWVDDAVPDRLLFDRLRLRQILLNLIGNAVKFTEHGGIDIEARVETSTEGRFVLISIIDTGIGIAEDKLRAIFSPFEQQDGSVARRFGGTGLGLSISSQLVEMMGGRITVHSKIGVGTQFTVRMPLVEAEEHDRPLPEAVSAVETVGHLHGARVLIAEDHAINQQLILAMASALGLDATLAENGEQAVDAVMTSARQGRPFDVVLMDMQMPGVDGLEATRRLRSAGFDADTLPIIALTANCYPEDVAACIAAGMQSHLGKPVTTVALARELARWVAPDAGNDSVRDAMGSSPDAIGTNAEFALPASIASLEERYRSRRAVLVSELRETLSCGEGTDWERLGSELHKLAGVAANFGEAEIGEASRRLERRIKAEARVEELIEALREEWPIFERAA
ncbi:PAS domain-containing hybrid sensor histidine kinase/response regulator [Aurantiacibacter luteus]|uniref:PAS domain-containing hybrid sensor histidine kinase/response regulator n=1 Tax=Aurantiacibacter luteus TaxID=1581420 RepID=UPI000A7605AB|nr:ATP-binding protein [Aurantiacibacter luteus]